MILNSLSLLLPPGDRECEQAFYDLMVRRALTLKDKDSAALMKEVLVRLYPVDKSTMPLVEFPFRDNGTPAEQISDINSAVAGGILPIDMGNTMVGMIVSAIKVFEVTELADRLAAIEEMLSRGSQ